MSASIHPPKPREAQRCTLCGKRSIPGLVAGNGKCQYHWNVGKYGKEWADYVEANR